MDVSDFGRTGGTFGRLRRFGFDAAPADGTSADGFFDGAEKDNVHELAVVEALEQDGDKERPVFVALERKSYDAGKHVDQQKAEEEENGALEIGGDEIHLS